MFEINRIIQGDVLEVLKTFGGKMKYLLIVAMLLCSGLVYAEILPDKFGGTEDRGFDATPPPLRSEEIPMAIYKMQADLLVMKYQIKKIEDTLDKIYSMVADLEIKFMGIKRYNQIYDPTNEGEVAKQKRHEEMIIEMMK